MEQMQMTLESLAGEIEQKMNEARELAKEKGKTAILLEANKIFAATPELAAIRWQQYTPHFNDGDPCVFNVQGISALVERTQKEYDDLLEHLQLEINQTREELRNYKPPTGLYGRTDWDSPRYKLKELIDEKDDLVEGGLNGNWRPTWEMKAGAMRDLIIAFETSLNKIDSYMQLVFGEGEITIDREGNVEVEECEHD